MIGRSEEKKYLLSLLEEEESQFVAVFGRRRIGKTYLVRETFDYHFTFEHTALSCDSTQNDRLKLQLNQFSISLRDAGFTPSAPLTSWTEAFDALKEVIRRSNEKKKVIFIDELSWMDTPGGGLISALENFWNGWVTARREKDVILIVSASATYWMVDKIVNSKGGLHNRLTGQIHLKPFTLNECKEYVESKNIMFSLSQILDCYMILGGIPYYWSLLRKDKSLAGNIDYLFFREGAMLQGEYDNLYKALFNSPEQYLKIIEALTKSGKGLTRNEIIAEAKIDSSGYLSRMLNELENCGFIKSYIPYGYKSNLAIYQLIDNYTLFYHKFLKEKHHDENEWSNKINTPQIIAWKGFAFERVCLEHIPQIKKALGISGVSTTVNAWKCSEDAEKGIKGSQIDLLIVRKDLTINVCEMKYSDSSFTINQSFSMDMKRKMEDLRKKTGTKYALYSTLITTYPINKTPYSDELQAVITMEELFTA